MTVLRSVRVISGETGSIHEVREVAQVDDVAVRRAHRHLRQFAEAGLQLTRVDDLDLFQTVRRFELRGDGAPERCARGG